ncbi:MAG: tRNA 4-thiouridine(8) synthase ThiI [Candidatus Pacearchaeota archaeon]
MIKKNKKIKALVLYSGGVDSRLVCKILQEQLKIEAITFLLPFIKKEKLEKSLYFLNKEKIKYELIDVTKGKLFKEYINIIKKPKFGRGTALNPCIDCHIFLLKKAKEYSNKKKIKIIATGDVLNERPFSQTKKSLLLIDKEIGFDVLRPLSAKLLPETIYEKEKLVDREKFFSIQSRSRKKQIELAKKYNIEFINPAGGCLLCEKEYCKKLFPLLKKNNITFHDIELLSIGRHFFSNKIILGRNKEENMILEKEKGIKIIPIGKGPSALVKNKKYIKKAKELIRRYSKNKIEKFIIKY